MKLSWKKLLTCWLAKEHPTKLYLDQMETMQSEK